MFHLKTTFTAATLVISSFFAVPVMAADGTITINGKITDTTCTISVNGGTTNATVTLPTVSASSLPSSGSTAGATPFSISLNTCSGSAMGTAKTYFELGAFVDGNSGRLNIDSVAPGAASNVQVELLNANRAPIVVGASMAAGQNDIPVDITAGNGTLNYFAQYHATAPAGAGSVTTQVDYTMTYE